MLDMAGYKIVTAVGEEAVREVCKDYSTYVVVIEQASARVPQKHVFARGDRR